SHARRRGASRSRTRRRRRSSCVRRRPRRSEALELTIERELAAIVGDDAVAPVSERGRYSTDESGAVGAPEVAVRPADTAAVAAMLAFASERAIPVTPMGARSGLSGGAVPIRSGIALSLERFDRLGPVDRDNLRISVGAGARTVDVQRAALEARLFYPP